jgi:hypothetical protein
VAGGVVALAAEFSTGLLLTGSNVGDNEINGSGSRAEGKQVDNQQNSGTG